MNKTVIAQIKSEGASSRRLTYTISTKDLDRDNDRILDWDLKAYRSNPVVLAFHDYRSLPVAKTVSINQVGDNLVATAEFIAADLSPFADQCFRMAAGGFMSGCSVGFRPSPGSLPKSNEFGGFDFPKAELLEWSLVPVPANGAALRRGVGAAMSRSISDAKTLATREVTDLQVRAIIERQLAAADNLVKAADLSDEQVIRTIVRNVNQVLAAVDAAIAKTKADEKQLEASVARALDRLTPQQLKALARGYEHRDS